MLLSKIRWRRESLPESWRAQRTFKRRIEPRPQIPIGQQIEAEQRGQVRETPGHVDFSCRNFSSSIAIRAIQIWTCTAFSLVPTNVLILRCCFKALKRSSICHRSL